MQVDWKQYIPEWIPFISREQAPAQTQPSSKEQLRSRAIGTVRGGLTVNQIEGTMLLRIGFRSDDPDFAAEMANIISELFIEFDLESRLESFEKATSWLTERTKGIRDSLDLSEKELQDYREKEQLVNLESGSSILGRQMEDAFENLTVAEKERIAIEKIYNDVDNLRQLPFEEAVNHPSLIQYGNIKEAKSAELDAQLAINQLAKRYGPKHPKMISARTVHETTISRLKKEVDIVLNNVEKELEQAKWTEQRLQKQFDDLKKQAQEVDRKRAQLNTLQRSVDADQELYDLFLTRFKETNISSDVNTPNARIIDRALTPGAPYWPNTNKIVMPAIGAGLLLGIMLAFFLEYLNNTIKSSDEVEEKLGISLLGGLQLLDSKKHTGDEDFKPERMFLNDPKSVFSESIRTIRTGVMLSALDSPYKIVSVTSTIPGEGKTTVSINLAIALGQLEKVLLIDADMRRATLGPHFGFSTNLPGLSDLVAGTHKYSECIHQMKESNIDILPAGAIPPNPQELLSSHRFEELLHKLSEHYDRIVIDTAPTQLVSDPILVANLSSGVVYVIRAEHTPYQLAREGIQKLSKLDTPIIGAVLNKVSNKSGKYGSYGRYGKYGYENYNYTYDSKNS